MPLVVPMIVDPSAMAALLLLRRSAPEQMASLLLALTIVWGLSGAILLSSTFLHRLLHERGLIAMERLMGMLLAMIAVQMFMNGVKAFLAPLSGHVGRPDYAVKLPGIGFPLNKGGE